MPIDILAQSLINGIFLGGVYALVAGGLTLIYGVIYIVNFAHADFLMVGMYIAYWAFVLLGIDPYISVFLCAIILFIIGVITQKVLIKPILKAPMLNQILLTMGLSSLLVGLAQFFWRSEPRSVLVPYSANRFVVSGIIFNVPRMVAFIVSVVITIGLYLFLKNTKPGKAIRACSQSRPAAQLMGIDVNKMYMLTFGIGAGLTGIAGALLTPTYSMSPTVGLTFAITAFVVVVLGTMGNFLGAFIGALIIGVTEAFSGLFLGGELRQLGSMVIFILVLLLRPGGLFGGKK